MKKVYSTEFADTLVALAIIGGFFGLMAAVAVMFGL
jgi:hypothetical protein